MLRANLRTRDEIEPYPGVRYSIKRVADDIVNDADLTYGGGENDVFSVFLAEILCKLSVKPL
jgi:hypothetical protein